ncbi:hypothetical protein J5I95_15815, partial [Candidatus Poribacteria bacterium]|nr:hypothetical protein [Candidatus Poribacteria bacterium]
GAFSIFDLSCHDLHEFPRAVYLIINEHSNWDTGISHALSYRCLGQLLNVDMRSVKRGVKELIASGFLKKRGRCSKTGSNIYQVIHHKCGPEEVPLDKDGRPQKCAVPRGEGSPSAFLEAGKIHWRDFMYWIVKKIHSDWTDGTARLTLDQLCKLLRFGRQQLCNIGKKLRGLGLMKRLSAKFRAGVDQLFPGPYPKRRRRSDYKGPKPLRCIKGWYYSHNKLWKFHEDTQRLMMKETDGRWRDSNMEELYNLNAAIHRDFHDYMSVTSSQEFLDCREGLLEALGIS